MTFIVARKFGPRTLIAADTMISGTEARPNAIPGQLKAAVLNGANSLAYAGRVSVGIDAIRATRALLLGGKPRTEIFEMLCSTSAAFETDFVFASHESGPELFKIWSGNISNDVDFAWIGDPVFLPELSQIERQVMSHPEMRLSRVEYQSDGEHCFRVAYQNLFLERGARLSQSIGGLPIFLLASPYGHTYLTSAVSEVWDKPLRELSERERQDELSGLKMWQFVVQSTEYRGAAVVGIDIPQANVAYIYSPVQEDVPVLVTDRSQFMTLMRGRSKALGGFVNEETPLALSSRPA